MNSSFRCDIISTFKDMLSQYSKDTAKVFITPYLFCLLALSKTKGYILSLALNMFRKLCNPLFLAMISQFSRLIAVYYAYYKLLSIAAHNLY